MPERVTHWSLLSMGLLKCLYGENKGDHKMQYLNAIYGFEIGLNLSHTQVCLSINDRIVSLTATWPSPYVTGPSYQPDSL